VNPDPVTINIPSARRCRSLALTPHPPFAAPRREVEEQSPKTVHERALQAYYQTNPTAQRIDEVDLHGLTPSERQTWASIRLLPKLATRKPGAAASVVLPPKLEREYWKQLGRENIPARGLRFKDFVWGRDRTGRDVGEYSVDEFSARRKKEERVVVLTLESERFRARRELEKVRGCDRKGEKVVVSEEEKKQERKRREEAAGLKKDLYGTTMMRYTFDPAWDDVVPLPADEPDMALAAIAYPEDYVEGERAFRRGC
jgi:protein farnesyltransferase/geranylgeranyltransferase type-1 subunit alpha